MLKKVKKDRHVPDQADNDQWAMKKDQITPNSKPIGFFIKGKMIITLF
jgi:hypothetical protein